MENVGFAVVNFLPFGTTPAAPKCQNGLGFIIYIAGPRSPPPGKSQFTLRSNNNRNINSRFFFFSFDIESPIGSLS